MDSVITQSLQPQGVEARKSVSTRMPIPWWQGRSSWCLKRVLLGLHTCLIAASIVLMASCSDDDGGGGRVSVAQALRISDDCSVFGLFRERGAQGFVFPDGLFGPTGGSTSRTVLRFSDVNIDQNVCGNSTARFATNVAGPDDPQDSQDDDGEGDADAGDSCFYQYKDRQDNNIGPRVPCGLCDFVVTAEDVQCGETGPGQMVLQLDTEDTPETRLNPGLQSNLIDVTVERDNDCNIVSVNGVSVVVD